MIFLDSSILIAHANKRDQAHNSAITIVKEIDEDKYGSYVITDYVFDETLTTILSQTRDLQLAVETGKRLLESAVLIHTDPKIFSNAFDRFRKQGKHDLSFTDCSILEVCKANGITRLATFDNALKEESGLDIVD
jgi:predicted nucleic acid-binding protein